MNIKAFAKINLTLDITGIMPNGFHSLRSVMAPISLCDEITIEKSDELSFDCNIKSIATEDNLCVRAAKLFFQKSNVGGNAKIFLHKKIPFPAGLGGGSADGAAVLKGLNDMFGHPLGNDELFLLAADLGSDVPLCLLCKPALCEGRGEIMTPVSDLPKFDVVIAIGKERLSTPAVFREYDSANLPVRNDSDDLLAALAKGDMEAIVDSLGNAFEPVVDILAPETKLLREEMQSMGALASHLSGSGPSVYGIFADDKIASLVAEELQSKGYSAYHSKIL